MRLLPAVVVAVSAALTAPPASVARASQAQPPQAQKGLDPMRPETTPTEGQLGVQIFPNAQFLRSYDAGRGQRFYIFASQSSFAEVVAYYRTVLRQRGYNVFDTPPTHSFEVGRFREETMSFPPGVTVKDFTSGGSAGYPNPKPGAQPARFPTIVQIVPVPSQ
jgi:hypothetical protein